MVKTQSPRVITAGNVEEQESANKADRSLSARTLSDRDNSNVNVNGIYTAQDPSTRENVEKGSIEEEQEKKRWWWKSMGEHK